MANTARNKPGEERIIETETPEALVKVQSMYETNKNRINTSITVILVVVLGYFAYQKFYIAPRETKAAAAAYFPQRYFSVDSLDKALNGDGQHKGFLSIEKQYSGTKTANLCHFYSGVCYLHMGDSKNAIKQLEDFDAKGTAVQYIAIGTLGDAYMDAGNNKKGIECYEKAAANKEDKILTPMYLSRVATAYEMNNQPEEAKKMYKRLHDEYPQSPSSRDAERNLARLGELN
ncbi:MAG: tetratricopeptide repeat protein [Bacteroidota bacterium]